MGLTLDVDVVDTPDAIRIEISGDGGEVLLKRKGEALDALQQIVNTGFPPRAGRRPQLRRRLHGLPQGQGRRAQADDAVHDGEGEALGSAGDGPAEPYSRRLVHLTVAEDPSMSSESIGDAFLKTVIISKK